MKKILCALLLLSICSFCVACESKVKEDVYDQSLSNEDLAVYNDEELPVEEDLNEIK